MSEPTHSSAGAAFTKLIVETFRLNGRLLAAGDELCRDLGLSSARWQVMAAIDDAPLSVAQIARNMGLTRQAVQRVADDLAAEGFVLFRDNPRHRRAKLVGLSAKGRAALDRLHCRHASWANVVTQGLDPHALSAATALAAVLNGRLAVPERADEET